MTVDHLNQRDRRIAELEAIGRAARTLPQQDELTALIRRRDQQWCQLRARIQRARGRTRELETYAQQIGLPLE